MYDPNTDAVAFHGSELVASGRLGDVARAVKLFADAHLYSSILTFDANTSQPIELDLRGTPDDVVARLVPPVAEKRGPGRPKLGVVAREITLLPRHWEWLSAQPGGASVTLRKLVEQARKNTADGSRAREARDIAYRFMYAVAGNQPDFEEVSRALYAGDADTFHALTEVWPAGVRDHVRRLAVDGLTSSSRPSPRAS